MEDRWLTFCYQYGIGGLLFFSSLMAALKGGALRPREIPSDMRLLAALLGGYAGFLLVHGAWIWSVG